MESTSELDLVFDVTKACMAADLDMSNRTLLKSILLTAIRQNKYPASFDSFREKVKRIPFVKEPGCRARVVMHVQKRGGLRVLIVYRNIRTRYAGIVS